MRINHKITEVTIICVYIYIILLFSFPWLYNNTREYVPHLYLIAIALMFISVNLRKIHRTYLIAILIVALGALIAMLLNHMGIGMLVNLFFPLAILFIFKNMDLCEKKFYKTISVVSIIFLYALVSKSFFVYREIYLGRTTYESFKEINPNTTAEVLVYLYLFSNLEEYVPRRRMIFRTIMIMLGLIWCGSRTSLISFFAVLICIFFIQKKICKSRKLYMTIIFSSIILGILFPMIYIYIFTLNKYSNITFLGKQLFTGRQWIWMNFFDYVKLNPVVWFIGTGYNDTFYVVNGTGAFNLHNMYLALFAMFGLVVTVLYLGIIINVQWKAYDRGILSQNKFYAAMVWLIVFVDAFAETSLSFIPMLIFPALALGILASKETSYNGYI